MVTPAAVVVVTLAVAVVVTPAVADRRRVTVLRRYRTVADRATPAMEDTNTNPDMCSPGETISMLNHVGFHQIFPDWTTQSGSIKTRHSSIDQLERLRVIRKRITSIREADFH